MITRHVRIFFIGLFVICTVGITGLCAQTPARSHGADLVFRDGKVIRRIQVSISQDQTTLTITGTDRKKPFAISLPVKDIARADYNYTEKPLVLEAVGTTSFFILISSFIGVPDLAIFMPMVLTKKKRHWLVIETGDQRLLFQLKNKDYRQLILEMHDNGIGVEDSGKIHKAPIGSDKP